MPLTVSPHRLNRVSFFYGMITGTFVASRTYDTDLQVANLYDELITVPRPADMRNFFDSYATCVVLTQSCEFNWAKDDSRKVIVPNEIRNFEKFWAMVMAGETPNDCFDYFAKNVSHSVLLGDDDKTHPVKGWITARTEALIVWRPPDEWKLEDELTDEQKKTQS